MLYHEHDPPGAAGSRFVGLARWARRRLAARATVLVVPSEARIQPFSAETGVSPAAISCVWNCPARAEADAPNRPRDDKDLWVLYHGSIVPSRLPLAVIDALALLPREVKLRVVGYQTVGHASYLDELRAHAARLGVSERVDLVGPVPLRADLLAWARSSDVGLALMPLHSDQLNEQTMAGASNKPFDYLACGVPLLVSDRPDWRALYLPDYGRACDPEDPRSLGEALRWFLEHPAERRAMGERGRRRVAETWNYETQFAPVREQLE